MSAEENKATVRRFLEEAFGGGKKEVIDEVLHSDFVCYDPNSESGEIRGADTCFAAARWEKYAPDVTLTIFQTVSEGKFCDLRRARLYPFGRVTQRIG